MGRWYGVAVGGLKWSPRMFWRSTLSEFFMAIEGHNNTQQPSRPAAMTRAEFEELEARYLGH